jgi:GTPase SAR1 family protein
VPNSLFTTLIGVGLKHHGDIYDGDNDYDQEPDERTRPMRTELTRQPATKQPATKRMTLAAVSRGVVTDPLRIFIYGVGGVGKTTFLSEMPNPVFIDTQAGSANLNVARFPRPECWEDVLAAVDELITSEHDYKSLVIDLLDDVEQLSFAHVMTRDDVTPEKFHAYGSGYKTVLADWRILLSKLERLRRDKGMAIGFGGHCVVKNYKNPEGEDFDRYQSSLCEQVSGLIRGWCDTVLFARHEVRLKTDTKKKRTRGVSTGTRLIHTVESAAFYAKNRHGLPDTLELSYQAFADACVAGEPADATAIMVEMEELLSVCADAQLVEAIRKSFVGRESDAAYLARVLNKARARIETQQQQTQSKENAQ